MDKLGQNHNVETTLIKCESCGSNMSFDPNTQKLRCVHCGSLKEIKSDLVRERDILTAFSQDNRWDEKDVSVFRCENCGAKVVLQINETAKMCPFCGTSHVAKLNELAGIKPNGLLSFAFDEQKALQLSKDWAKKRFFAPRKFKKNLNLQNVNGIYSPCFTFDSNTFSQYHGRIGKTHTRVVGSGKNRRTQTYIVWRNISGTHSTSFDDVLISAGSRLGQDKLDKISPFDTNYGKEYEQSYLLGYVAYHYDRDIEECWDIAKKRIDDNVKKQILSNYVYDHVDYLNVSTVHENVTYKYVMLPIYVGNFNHKKKLYNFFVNGSSGKVWGKYPKSIFKIALTVFGALAIASIIGFLLFF